MRLGAACRRARRGREPRPRGRCHAPAGGCWAADPGRWRVRRPLAAASGGETRELDRCDQAGQRRGGRGRRDDGRDLRKGGSRGRSASRHCDRTRWCRRRRAAVPRRRWGGPGGPPRSPSWRRRPDLRTHRAGSNGIRARASERVELAAASRVSRDGRDPRRAGEAAVAPPRKRRVGRERHQGPRGRAPRRSARAVQRAPGSDVPGDHRPRVAGHRLTRPRPGPVDGQHPPRWNVARDRWHLRIRRGADGLVRSPLQHRDLRPARPHVGGRPPPFKRQGNRRARP